MKPYTFAMLFLLLVTGGCASIPEEAPTLSAELGKRISAIEESHIMLLRAYIDEKRKRIDDFVVAEWTPKFAEAVFEGKNISAAWDDVVANGDKNDRLTFLMLVGPKLQERINLERLKYVGQLDALEKDIERRLRDEYRQSKAINNSLTSYLTSASNVAANRDRYLEEIGIQEDKYRNAIDDADRAISELTENKGSIEERYLDFKYSLELARQELRR